jgi:hypothetical protein
MGTGYVRDMAQERSLVSTATNHHIPPKEEISLSLSAKQLSHVSGRNMKRWMIMYDELT